MRLVHGEKNKTKVFIYIYVFHFVFLCIFNFLKFFVVVNVFVHLCIYL
jgi:hypothetical protein